MPTISWHPSTGVVCFILSSLCSHQLLWTVDAFPDKPSSVPTNSQQSRNKKGRITQFRGGSQSYAETHRQRMRLRDQELDEYIDFLIDLYCDEEEEGNIAVVEARSSGARKALNRKEDQRIETETKEENEEDSQQEEQVTFHVDTTSSASYNVSEDSSRLFDHSASLDQQKGGGDDDDDDHHSEDSETELLDRYIEFIQEDYENERALDKYIDFVQQDYDNDRALDDYVDFLLATTTASMPDRTNATDVTIETTLLPPEVDEVVVLPETGNKTELQHQKLLDAYIDRLVAAVESEEEQQILLDAYIDRLVTAVELDEYIDSLVESVSGAREGPETDVTTQPLAIPQEKEEDVPDSVVDSYIETLVSVGSLDDPEDTSPAVEAPEASEVIPANTMPTGDETSKVSLEEVILAAEEEPSPSRVDVRATEKPALKATTKPKTQSKKKKATTSTGAATPVVKTASSRIARETATVLDSDQPESVEAETTIADGVRAKVSSSSGGDDDGDDDRDDDSKQPDPVTDAEEPRQVDAKPKKKRKKKAKVLKAQVDTIGKVEEDPVAVAIGEVETKENQDEEPVAGASALPHDAKAVDSKEEESQETAFIQSPNGLYRFLLSKGTIGHIIVLAIVLLVEWVQLYLPQLAELLAVLWTTFAPTGLQRRMAPQKYKKGGEGTSSAHLQHLYSGRMPVKGKEGRKLKERIDQEALDLLVSIGDVQEAKYKHVSDGFLQRHGLGPYRNDMVDGEDSPSNQKKGMRSKKKPKLQDDEDGEESDVDWVLEGLSDGKSIASEPKSPIDVSFGMGPKGPVAAVGVEFSLGGSEERRKPIRKKKRSFNADSIVRDSVRKRKSGPRPSDKDGGGGVLGRLRAAATSNSLMKRNLLGAYPGDAAPLSESADSGGVSDLARKYGYGDWSDDDDSDDGNGPTGRKRKSRKRSKATKKRSDEMDDFGLGDILSAAEEDQFDLGGLVSDAEPDDADAVFQSTQNTRKKKGKSSTSSARSAKHKAVRPSLDRLNETKKGRKKDKGKLSSQEVSGLEKLAKRADDKKQKSVRPALERLNEIKNKGKGDSKEN